MCELQKHIPKCPSFILQLFKPTSYVHHGRYCLDGQHSCPLNNNISYYLPLNLYSRFLHLQLIPRIKHISTIVDNSILVLTATASNIL